MLARFAYSILASWMLTGLASAQLSADPFPYPPLDYPPTVDFDELEGQPPPFDEGTEVQERFLVDKQYEHLGIDFDAPGGGFFVGRTRLGSAPSAAGVTGPGPRISHSDTGTISFWKDGLPAKVHYLRLRSTGPFTFRFHGLPESGVATASGGRGYASIAGSGTHRVEVDLQPTAFVDDILFADLEVVHTFALSPPSPGRAGATNELLVSGGRPGETVLVEVALDAGTRGARPLAGARLSRTARLDDRGRATVSVDVPGTCAGLRLNARAWSASGLSTPLVRDHLGPAPR